MLGRSTIDPLQFELRSNSLSQWERTYKKESILNTDFLNKLFEYRDGNLYYKHKGTRGIKEGTIAGNITSKGYIRIQISGFSYALHRVVWILHYGRISQGKQIDHINGNKSDNRIENLRLCTQSQNTFNKPLNKKNKTGYKGIKKTRSNRWTASIKTNGKSVYLGTFITAETAAQSYKNAANKLHGEFVRYK